MILCRVMGNVVATVKHPGLKARAVMAVQPVTPRGAPDGDSFLAVDHSQAGPGDLVLVHREGNGIRQMLGDANSPIRCLIVGVVDAVNPTADA